MSAIRKTNPTPHLGAPPPEEKLRIPLRFLVPEMIPAKDSDIGRYVHLHKRLQNADVRVLTGRSIPQEIIFQYDPPTQTPVAYRFQRNLQIAEQVNRLIQGLDIFSPNFPDRDAQKSPEREKWPCIKEKDRILAENRKNPGSSLSLTLEKRVGNCAELSALAFRTIRHAYPEVKVVGAEFGEHNLVVIDPDSSASVVLDVWSNAFYLYGMPYLSGLEMCMGNSEGKSRTIVNMNPKRNVEGLEQVSCSKEYLRLDPRFSESLPPPSPPLGLQSDAIVLAAIKAGLS